MSLTLHGVSGDIRLANSYYEDPHDAVGVRFRDGQPAVQRQWRRQGAARWGRRFPFGVSKPDNGNYLWIQQFYAALNKRGRAGFVMANSAGDAGHTEREIRQQLIESGVVDVMFAAGTNFFYTVTRPVTLWFLDKGKRWMAREDKGVRTRP